MGVGEAIDICPELVLAVPDPGRAAGVWERVLVRLESVGVLVESERDGEAFFDSTGIERLHGGLGGVLDAIGGRLGSSFLVAAAPTRLAALALAWENDEKNLASNPHPDRSSDRRVLPPERTNAFLASLPLAILLGRLPGSGPESRRMLETMRKLGLKTLGDLAALPVPAVSDRFGSLGLVAHDLASGVEVSLRPRPSREEMEEWLELPDAATGIHLEGGLTILCDRLAERLRASGISARTLVMEARLLGGGSWTYRASPRRPTASSFVLRLLLQSALERLPRPAEYLGLRLLEAGPQPAEQLEVIDRPGETRRRRLREAASQVRAAVGESALMRVIETEPESRLPERRMLLTPYSVE